MLIERATPYEFNTKKSCQTNRNQLVINTENGEKRNLKQSKCLKTHQMNEGTRKRRETRAGSLKERFKSSIHMIKKKQLLINIYLIRQTRYPRKPWYLLKFHGMMWPKLFVNNNGVKVNKENISDIYIRSCFFLEKKLLNVIIGYLLKMERHLTDPTWYKIFLKQNRNVVSSLPKNGLHPHLM